MKPDVMVEPSTLPLAVLREVRAQLQADEDALSYVRRIAQARIDLVHAELSRRATGADSTELSAVFAGSLRGDAQRPPRPIEEFSDHPLAIELDDLCASLGNHRVIELDDAELKHLDRALVAFEGERSSERQALFFRLDAFSAELVRRYRSGEASVDGLLNDAQPGH